MLEGEKISGDAVIAAPTIASAGFQPTATVPKDAPKSKRDQWAKLGRRAATQYRAAVKLHCLDCVCWHQSEARDCQISTCSLWALNRRIFKGETDA